MTRKYSFIDHKPMRELKAEFYALVSAEPRLAIVERAVREHAAAHRRDRRYCANRHWYGYGNPYAGFKHRMNQLVGWGRNTAPEPLSAGPVEVELVHGSAPGARSADPLATQGAYDVAYDWLVTMLPDCRHEGICG